MSQERTRYRGNDPEFATHRSEKLLVNALATEVDIGPNEFRYINMGFYAKYVLPRLTDVLMRNKETTRLRAEWVPRARGDVLEVGVGSGLNLAFYPSDVRNVYGVDPSAELQQMARKRLSTCSLDVKLFLQSAEETLPLPDRSIDTVVMTWTLCSIPDPLKALHQMKRVLKPEGKLVFIEHGRSPDSRVAVWQDRLNPVWKRIGGGCNLNRKIDDLLAAGGFQIEELKTAYIPGPRLMTFMFHGLARQRD